ncbi:MAG: DsbA family oxidoreductase [Lysobacter sp.]
MPTPLRIDFVSDVSCPWCAVGLKSLQQAIDKVGDEVAVELHFQPFELNPQMAPEGEDSNEHLARKYGASAEQLAQNREVLRQRGAALGFDFNQRSRVYNTFDAHRLLHWAGEQGPASQLALKQVLLRAYFTDDRDVSSHAVLAAVAGEAGLDVDAARQVLDSDRYASEVRAREQLYQGRGITAVPSVILNDRHLIQGGQPVELFEQALRKVAAEAQAG